MGCVNSKTDINDRHPNIFHVLNVNDQGRPISPGKLEVTESELIFHQRGMNPTRWPLRSLRKYGFDIEVFSFECGRRSPTGPGIYAFRCRKAEQLFNIVQHYITGNVNDENPILNSLNQNNIEFSMPTASTGPHVQRRTARHNSEEGYLNPVQPSSRPHTAVLSRPGSISSNGQLSPTATSPPATTEAPPIEHNNNKRNSVVENGRGPPSYANLGAETLADSSCHVYMNVDTKEVTKDAEEIHCYANIDTKDIIQQSAQFVEMYMSGSVPHTPTVFQDTDYITVREVNYAELDLDSNKNDSAQSPTALTSSEHESCKKKGYATIDFPKTIALSQSINPKIEMEEGSRKTRHNSTINSFSD